MQVEYKIDKAVVWLETLLRQHGSLLSSEVKFIGLEAGFSPHIVKRAAQRLNIRVNSTSRRGRPRMTEWRLPK